jgi:hypothetical protein
MQTALTNILAPIRNREALYNGNCSIERLAAFLRGCDHILKRERNGESDKFLQLIQLYVSIKEKIRISRSWDEIIAFICINDEECMGYFWSTFDTIVSGELTRRIREYLNSDINDKLTDDWEYTISFFSSDGHVVDAFFTESDDCNFPDPERMAEAT